jgi:hypothetical protein
VDATFWSQEQPISPIYIQALTRICPQNQGDDYQSESGNDIDTYIDDHDGYKNPQDDDEYVEEDGYFEDTWWNDTV